MKKIALVTFYTNNFGSMLQCFATKKFLESLGYQCDLLYQFWPNLIWMKLCTKFKIWMKSILFASFRKDQVRRVKAYRLDGVNPSAQTKKEMNHFIDEWLSPIAVTNRQLMNKKWQDQYEYFIAGSDQIWNASYLIEKFYFLDFAPHQKRIALAISFGNTEIPSYNKRVFRSLLRKYDLISIREESGNTVIKNNSSAKVVRVADPTLIYSKIEWEQFCNNEKKYIHKYILIHFLNKPSEVAIASIKWLSMETCLDVVAIGYNYEEFNQLGRFVYIDGGPRKYVSLIDNAEYVMTDSFHSTIFSINLGIPFFVFHRQYSYKPQTSRIVDLLDLFSLKDRLIEDLTMIKLGVHKQFSLQVKTVLEKERIAIRNFIQQAVSGKTSAELNTRR